MKRPTSSRKQLALATLTLGVVGAVGCTGQIPNSFRFAQQSQTFGADITINTKIDLLWVIDNSSSMNAQQDKLRQGLASFAVKYMQPTWDIQVAVITTDAYLANPAYTNYLNTTISGTTGWQSPYVYGRRATWVNPASNPTLVNTSTWNFDAGIQVKDLVPAWGSNYAKLLPGLHDGPVAGFCFEGMQYSMYTSANCQVRDQSGYTDASHCLTPSGAETPDQMCQNTTQNNTVRSGKAIIKTMPASTLTGAALTAWTNQLITDFKVNATTGITGMGSERGLGSVLQLISDNEAGASATRFFRPGALRGIIIVTDEDDQTEVIPAATQLTPFQNYMCDQASLVTMNPTGNITGVNGYCCSTAGNNCRYGSVGTSCPAKVIDGSNLVVSLCPDPTKLMPVASVKNQLDSFFSALDAGGSPNYFVATITPLTMASITSLQALHDTDDTAAGNVKNKAVDRGDRYIALGTLVGNGSMSMDINSTDYSPLLDQIGQAILLKKSTFPLARIPTGQEDMIITLIHEDGSSMIIPNSKYTISGSNVVITDQTLVLSFKATDKLTVSYQPKYVNQ